MRSVREAMTSKLRLLPAGSSSLLSSHRQHLSRWIVIDTMGFLAILSLVLMAGAADNQSGGGTGHWSGGQVLQFDGVSSLSAEGGASAAGSAGNSSSSSLSTSIHGSGSNLQVIVNGQPIDVPQNGTHEETITTPNGSTSVTVTNNSSSEGSASNTSVTTTSTNVHSSSSRNVINQETHTSSR